MGETGHIHFLITGGTLDGCCAETTARPASSGLVDCLQKRIKPHFTLTAEVLFLRDSRHLTEADREHMAAAIQHCPHRYIILTHGTYTLCDTAVFLHQTLLPAPPKTVIITGAMIPMAEPDSDALFNLGFACHAVLTQSPGIWVAMHGRIWPPGAARKNNDTARFEDV